MFDHAQQDNELRRVMDACLPGLEQRPDFDRDVLRQVRGEEKVKKKLSVGLVLSIVFVLVAATALAATLLWENYAVEVKQTEHEQGEYEQWPLDEKLSLIQNLMDMGYLEASDDTAKLFNNATSNDDKRALADEVMMELTGQDDVSEINLDIITYAILGPSNTWTPEQRVWWQKITNMYRETDDLDTLILPGGDEISEAEAVAIGKAAVLNAHKLPENALDNARIVSNLYVTDQRPNYKRWDIQFQLFQEGADNWLERVYAVIVDEDGNVIADPDVNMPSVEELAATYQELQALKEETKSPIIQIYLRYREEQNHDTFRSWPIQVKAAYSREVRPLVQDALENGDLVAFDASEGNSIENKTIIASTTYAYGLPEAGDAQEETALEIATQRITEEFDRNASELRFVNTYYDITDPDSPLWKFIFYTDYSEELQASILYRVELNARTGAIEKTEAFERVSPLKNLDSALKLY